MVKTLLWTDYLREFGWLQESRHPGFKHGPHTFSTSLRHTPRESELEPASLLKLVFLIVAMHHTQERILMRLLYCIQTPQAILENMIAPLGRNPS